MLACETWQGAGGRGAGEEGNAAPWPSAVSSHQDMLRCFRGGGRVASVERTLCYWNNRPVGQERGDGASLAQGEMMQSTHCGLSVSGLSFLLHRAAVGSDCVFCEPHQAVPDARGVHAVTCLSPI